MPERKAIVLHLRSNESFRHGYGHIGHTVSNVHLVSFTCQDSTLETGLTFPENILSFKSILNEKSIFYSNWSPASQEKHPVIYSLISQSHHQPTTLHISAKWVKFKPKSWKKSEKFLHGEKNTTQPITCSHDDHSTFLLHIFISPHQELPIALV